jgi:hypothetical protein
MIRGRDIISFALVALVFAAAPSQAGAVERSFFGVVPQAGLTPEDFDNMESGKVGTLRIGADWRNIQPTARDRNKIGPNLDDEFGGAAAAGVEILPFINKTPSWVNPRPEMPPIGSDADREAFKNFMRLMAERYGPGGTYWRTKFRQDFPGAAPLPVTTWQIWNEPSSPASWDPAPNAKDYAKLVILAEKGLHEADPNAQVMLAGVYHDPRNGGPKAPDFIRKVLSEPGLKAAIDSVALHPYGKDPEEVSQLIGSVRSVIEQKGAADKELFITESGWSSGAANDCEGQSCTTLQGQAKKLKGSFRLAVQKKRAWNLGGIYWYSIADLKPNEPACMFCRETGLFTASRTPKPAWAAFKSFTTR